MGILELQGSFFKERRGRGSGEKWNSRREREGWPEETKAESEGEKIVRDGEWWMGVRVLETSWRVRDIEM